MRRVTIGILTVIVLAVLVVVLCTFRKRPYETVILDRFGYVVDQPAKIGYGWYWCSPVDKVRRLDNRLHLYNTPLSQIATNGGGTISVQTFAAWRITDARQFYSVFKGSDETAQRTMADYISATVGDIMPKHTLDELFNVDPEKVKTEQIEELVRKTVNDLLKNKGMGMEVAAIGFSQLAFPPTLADTVYARMTADRNTKAAEYESQGTSEATKIRAEGDRDAEATRVDAERKAQAIRAGADAEALQTMAKVQTPAARDFYRFWRELEIFKGSINKGTVMILQSGQPLSDQLFGQSSPARGATTQPGK